MAFTKIAAAGIGSTGTLTLQNVVITGVVTATSFQGNGSGITGLSKTLTIGVRAGSAVTFGITGSSFDVSGRSGNISISV